MENNIKMRAQLKTGFVEVKVLISHPMETGRRKDDAGQWIPAHFIQLITATLNDKPVLEAQWGTGISKNPYLTFHITEAQVGDKIAVFWQDNLGASGTGEIIVTQK